MYQRWKQRVENLALDVLQKTNALYSLPINVTKVAEKLGLQVIDHELAGDVSGVLILNDGKGTIGVNTEHADVRKRFTIAHEIGHFVLGHQREGSVFVDQSRKQMVIYRDDKSSTGEYQQEREANAFAAALLMPVIILKDKVKDYSFSFIEEPEQPTIYRLAQEFDVSTNAMAYRLSNLGYLSL